MSKRRNMDGDLNKSPLKEKSPMRELHGGRPLRENLTIEEAKKVHTKNDFRELCNTQLWIMTI